MKLIQIFATSSILLTNLLVFSTSLLAQENAHRHHQRYKLIDIGTFGGPQGFVNPEGNGGPYINHFGMIVGNTQTAKLLPGNADFFLCAPGPNVNHAFVARADRPVDLGALEPSEDNCSNALGINDYGEIAGQSSNGEFDPLLGVNQMRAVVWKGGKIEDLGTFGGNESAAGSINNRGQVTGFALNDVPDPYSIFGSYFLQSPNSTQTRAFVWKDGVKRDIGTLGGNDAQAFPGHINDRGEVSGISYTNTTPNATTGLPTIDPFLWDGHKMIDVGTLGGHGGFAAALNNRGEEVGNSNIAGDIGTHPFFWSNGTITDLGTFGGNYGDGNDLNDNGEVVGDGYFPGDQVRHAFLWSHGNKKDLGVLPRDKCSTASTINSRGQVVGSSGMCGFGIRAFIWEDGEMANLNDLVFPKSDVILVEPTVISEDGRIGVNGLPPGCDNGDLCGHPYLLIPDGDCDDNLSARITADQSRPAETLASIPPPNDQATKTDVVKTTMDRLRDQMRRKLRNAKGEQP
jgi:probable HAF family extracellular repeat protein